MYKPQKIMTCSDGWKTPADGTYVRPDGTTFSVSPKTYKSRVGGSYTTYGGYTQSELHMFSEAAKNKNK